MNETREHSRRPDVPTLVRKDNGFRYRQQYGVIVLCDDEAHHRRVYEELKAAGHTCRIVCV
jgi:hypothetical protein